MIKILFIIICCSFPKAISFNSNDMYFEYQSESLKKRTTKIKKRKKRNKKKSKWKLKRKIIKKNRRKKRNKRKLKWKLKKKKKSKKSFIKKGKKRKLEYSNSEFPYKASSKQHAFNLIVKNACDKIHDKSI